MNKEQIEKIFQGLSTRVVAFLAAGVTLATLSGCSKKIEVVTPEPSVTEAPSMRPATTLRPLPSGIILNGGEEVYIEEAETSKTPAPESTKVPESTKTPATTESPVVTEVPAVTESPAVTEAPVVTPAPVVTEHPDYPYAATITIPLNNGTNPTVSFATSKKDGKETVFISKDSAKVCGVMVTQSLIDALSKDPSIKTLEFEGCQIDTLSIANSHVNSLYLWNTYVRVIGSCNVGANFTLTLDHSTLGDPASLRNLPTCTSCTLVGIPSSYFSSIKELKALKTLIVKQSDIPSWDFVSGTGVQTLYVESCTAGYTPLTSQSLKTFSAFDVDLGDLSFLATSSVTDVNFRSCSFCNIESLDDSNVLSVKVDDFYTSRTRRNRSFQPDLLSLYDEEVYTLDLGL